MTHPNETLIRQYADAWMRGDKQAAEDFWANDIVLRLPGRNMMSGIYRGKKTVADAIDKLIAITDKAQILELYDVLADDKYAISFLKERFERSGKEMLEIDRIVVFQIRNNKITDYRIFEDDQHVVDEFFT